MDKAVLGWRPMPAGVPQGSTLSLMYNLYTSDIPKLVRTKLSVYPDDICIYHKNRSGRFAHLAVQRHSNDIGRRANEWRIYINAEKTKALAFSKRTRQKFPSLKL